LKFQFRSLSW